MPWKPGVSGNPGGRPKKDAELTIKCKDMTDDALGKLFEIMTATTEPDAAVRPSDQIKAAEIVLAYGHGRPRQAVDVGGESVVELLGVIAERANAKVKAEGEGGDDDV